MGEPLDVTRLRAVADANAPDPVELVGPITSRKGHLGRLLLLPDGTAQHMRLLALDVDDDYLEFTLAWTPEVALAALDRLAAFEQSDRAMARMRERAERERDEARAEVAASVRLRPLGRTPPGFYLCRECTGKPIVVEVIDEDHFIVTGDDSKYRIEAEGWLTWEHRLDLPTNN